MAFKNPSLISNGISKEEFEMLKEQVEKNTHDIEQMKKQENVVYNKDKQDIYYNKDEQEYIIKKETPNAAFLTSIPRILEIAIAPKESEEELIEDNDLENDMIPISSLYTEEGNDDYSLLDSIPSLAQVNGGQRTMTIGKSPVPILSKVQA